jgi:hypothetical protein
MIKFFSSLVIELCESNGYNNDIISFLMEVSFLDLQPNGKSQGVILNLLDEFLRSTYDLSVDDCGKGNVRFYIYLDDILCTGLTLMSDIIDWSNRINSKGIKNQHIIESGQAKLIFAFVFLHKMNYQKKISEMKMKISKRFSANCSLFCLIEIDNTLTNDSPVNLILPAFINRQTSLFGDALEDEISHYINKVSALVDQHTKKYNSVSPDEFFRPSHLPVVELFYSSHQNRNVVERAFLEKGIEILKKVKFANKNLRPLGYSLPSVKNFGFGALCFTWRNVPNTVPLVFWYSVGKFIPLFKVKRGLD